MARMKGVGLRVEDLVKGFIIFRNDHYLMLLLCLHHLLEGFIIFRSDHNHYVYIIIQLISPLAPRRLIRRRKPQTLNSKP
jgi:hypothetical protein